jgi:hypothetical protein
MVVKLYNYGFSPTMEPNLSIQTFPHLWSTVGFPKLHVSYFPDRFGRKAFSMPLGSRNTDFGKGCLEL